jgi:ABC-type lipoprotein release transport system permease subunit
MLWLKLAARNALRQRRRTLLTGGGLALGMAALLFAWAMFDGLNAQLVRNMTDIHSGHLQVQHERQLAAPRLDQSFALAEVQAALQHPAVRASAPRLSSTALIASGRHARGVHATGVDPLRERGVTTLHERIVQGRALQAGDEQGVMLGATLARALAVRVGDEVALVTEGLQGAIGARRLRVAGLYDSGNEALDAGHVFMMLGTAQQLFNAPDRVSAMALRLDSVAQAEVQAAALAPRLPAPLRLRGWRALLPPVAQSVDFHETVLRVVMAMLFGVVALGVASALQMSVAQRIREFGTLRAIGAGPAQLVRLILYEGGWIVAGALLLACAVALPAIAWLAARGVDFSNHGHAMQMMGGGTAIVMPQLRPQRLLEVGAGLFLVALLAAAVPALRVARLQPVQALRGRWRAERRVAHTAAPSGRWPAPLRLAARGLWRTPWRSGLSLAALGFGLAVFVFAAAFTEGFLAQMQRNATGLLVGDVQVQHHAFQAEQRADLAFDADPAWLARLAQLPTVAALSSRVQVPATLGSARRAEPVTLVGLDMAADHARYRLSQALRAGGPLRGERDMLIGRKLAERLDARIGEKLVVTLQDARGQLAFDAFRVAGFFDTGAHGADAAMVFVNLAPARRLLAVGPRDATHLQLQLEEGAASPPAAGTVARRAAALLPGGAGLQALAWPQLMPDVAQFAGLVRHGLLIVLAIVFAMVAVLVANAQLMSVLERTREFGTLLAIGAGGPAVLRLVMAEAVLLAALGTAGGLALGAAAAAGAAVSGIELAAAGGAATAGTSQVVHPVLSLPLLAGPAVLLFLLVLAASAYPAWRAVRLDPAQALRSVP